MVVGGRSWSRAEREARRCVLGEDGEGGRGAGRASRKVVVGVMELEVASSDGINTALGDGAEEADVSELSGALADGRGSNVWGTGGRVYMGVCDKDGMLWMTWIPRHKKGQ